MAQEDPSTWSVDQVVEQTCSINSALRQHLQTRPILNLPNLEIVLRDNDVDGETFLALNDTNIRDDLQIKSLGQRREIVKIVEHLRGISELYSSEKILKRRYESMEDVGGEEVEAEFLHETSPKSPPEPKKRRIQPELVSTDPISAPPGFSPEHLDDRWQAFLERHQEASDEEVLRPYNESDSEIELQTDDSLADDLESEVETIRPHLTLQEIHRIVDGAIENYRQSWVTSKLPKKHHKAYRRWMHAARAGTRKPQQNALELILTTYQDRLQKLRTAILDMGREWQRPDDFRQACQNLQATVEDIAEHEYYLEILESETPPQRFQYLGPVMEQHDENLLEDEEILHSSAEEDEEEDQEVFIEEDKSDRSVSLAYDPTDDDWRPQIPKLVPDIHQIVDANNEFLDDQFMTANEDPFEQPPDLEEAMSEDENIQLPSRSQILPDTVPPESKAQLETPNLLEALQHSIEVQMDGGSTPVTPLNSRQMQDDEVEEDSDWDQLKLPQSRYQRIGTTLDDAISLNSSPSVSDTSQIGSIHTPPLNPSTPTKVKSEDHTSLAAKFPPIQATRALKMTAIGNDPFMLLCKSVYKRTRDVAQEILDHIRDMNHGEAMSALQATLSEWLDSVSDDDEMENAESDPEIVWAFLYIIYACGTKDTKVWDVSAESLDRAFEAVQSKTYQFHRVLKPLLQYYIDTQTTSSSGKGSSAIGPHRQEGQIQEGGALKSGRSKSGEAFPNAPKLQTPMSITDTESDLDEPPSAHKVRKRQVHQSQEALLRQRADQARVEAQEEQRRQLMLARFNAQDALQSDKIAPIPINTQEPFVYLDPHIAKRVKPHQIEGIQFIWRELVTDPKHQGCLLAHTMGLGKTMQVISFLVTLAQANSSPKLQGVVPVKLRSKKVLIICPASLVDNWYDELLMWSPPGHEWLGRLYNAQGTQEQKKATVLRWHSDPGVLIIGYESLKALVRKSRKNDPEDHANIEKILLEEPCVVVADEAHKMKNAKSAVNQLAMQLRTMSRIALTGSPLNNHLEEYHTMIDWIAPGYLGTLVQFKSKYSEPIARGLYSDSSRYEKRKSLEKLYVLKRDLAPKIDRKDISAIAKDMPQKTEFFITVPLTDLQKTIYTTIVQHVLRGIGSAKGQSPKASNAQLWTWLAILSWLCNHPSCLIKKLEEKNYEVMELGESTFNNPSLSTDGDFLNDEGLPDNVDLAKSPMKTLLPKFLDSFKAIDRFNNREDPSLSLRAMVVRSLISESIAHGDKILVFSHSIPTLDFLQNMVQGLGHNCMRIDGSVKADLRQNYTKHFNETGSDHMVFLISTRAGGLGLNLQGANRVVIFDFGFNPSWEEQAIGRAYRLGQKKHVYVYRFRAGGTYEETMYNKAIFKTQLFSRVVDQKNVVRHATKQLEDYLFLPTDAEQQDLSEYLGKDALLDKIIQQNPGAIRNIVLTETFQREDEEDELTEIEKASADEQFRIEQLARTNPVEHQKALQAAHLRERAAQLAQLATNVYRPPMIPFAQAFDPGLNVQNLSTRGIPQAAASIVQNGGNVSRASSSRTTPEKKATPNCAQQ